MVTFWIIGTGILCRWEENILDVLFVSTYVVGMAVLNAYCLVLRFNYLGTFILPRISHPRSRHVMTLFVHSTRLTKNFGRIVV